MRTLRIILPVLVAAVLAAPSGWAAGIQRPAKVPTLGKKQGGGGNRRNNRNNRNNNAQQQKKPAASKTASAGNEKAPAAATGDRLEQVLTAPPSSTGATSASDAERIRQVQARLDSVQGEAQMLATVKEKLLLSKWTPDRVMDEEGNTLLHLAARSGYLSVVQHLLAEGANPTIRNKIMQTPLDMAAAIQRTDIEDALKAAIARRPAAP